MPSIQENLVSSLKALNDTGHLTYLIKELNERKTNSEAEVFILTSLCIYCYPHIITHPQRQKFENLYDACFSKAKPSELFEILDRPCNNKIKELLYDYLKLVVAKYKSQTKKKPPAFMKQLLDHYVKFVAEGYQPHSKKAAPALVKYLIDDYLKFTREKLPKLEKTSLKKPLKRG